MNNREDDFERNLGRLLKASCGPEAALSPAERERLRARLVQRLKRRQQTAEFPERILGAITVLFVLVFAVCAWREAPLLVRGIFSGPVLILTIVNAVGILTAGLVIVLRRKHA